VYLWGSYSGTGCLVDAGLGQGRGKNQIGIVALCFLALGILGIDKLRECYN